MSLSAIVEELKAHRPGIGEIIAQEVVVKAWQGAAHWHTRLGIVEGRSKEALEEIRADRESQFLRAPISGFRLDDTPPDRKWLMRKQPVRPSAFAAAIRKALNLEAR